MKRVVSVVSIIVSCTGAVNAADDVGGAKGLASALSRTCVNKMRDGPSCKDVLQKLDNAIQEKLHVEHGMHVLIHELMKKHKCEGPGNYCSLTALEAKTRTKWAQKLIDENKCVRKDLSRVVVEKGFEKQDDLSPGKGFSPVCQYTGLALLLLFATEDNSVLNGFVASDHPNGVDNYEDVDFTFGVKMDYGRIPKFVEGDDGFIKMIFVPQLPEIPGKTFYYSQLGDIEPPQYEKKLENFLKDTEGATKFMTVYFYIPESISHVLTLVMCSGTLYVYQDWVNQRENTSNYLKTGNHKYEKPMKFLELFSKYFRVIKQQREMMKDKNSKNDWSEIRNLHQKLFHYDPFGESLVLWSLVQRTFELDADVKDAYYVSLSGPYDVNIKFADDLLSLA